jgi:hypothetical protein
VSELSIYPDNDPASPRRFTEFDDIRRELDAIGIRFERWDASKPVAPGASQEEILEAYRDDVDRLMRENGFQSADVVSLTPDHPQREACAPSSWMSTPTARTRCASSWTARASSIYTRTRRSTPCCARRAI